MPSSYDAAAATLRKKAKEKLNVKFDGAKYAIVPGTPEMIERALKLPVDKGVAYEIQNADGTFKFLAGYDDFSGTIT